MLTLEEVLNDFALYIGSSEPTTAGLSARGPTGESPLHWMATLGDAPAIRLLVLNGAEMSAPDHQGNTPLHEAIVRRHVAAAQALLELGANANLRNALGQTPEDVARADGHVPMLTLFKR